MIIHGLVAVFPDEFVALGGFQVFPDHFGDEFVEGDLGLPPSWPVMPAIGATLLECVMASLRR
jgi:hypothetical protein